MSLPALSPTWGLPHVCSTAPLLPLFTGDGDEEQDARCNRKSFHLFPAASITYFYSIFLPPGLHVPWEGLSGTGFH